jgi:hypothetical protein
MVCRTGDHALAQADYSVAKKWLAHASQKMSFGKS